MLENGSVTPGLSIFQQASNHDSSVYEDSNMQTSHKINHCPFPHQVNYQIRMAKAWWVVTGKENNKVSAIAFALLQ